MYMSLVLIFFHDRYIREGTPVRRNQKVTTKYLARACQNLFLYEIIYKGIFRTQVNIYDRAFFVKKFHRKYLTVF